MTVSVVCPIGRRDHRRAFTLYELLVVVGIIGVLVALLLPVMARVRKSAMATTCASNLRQLSCAWIAYCGDNDGSTFSYYSGSNYNKTYGLIWGERLNPYLSQGISAYRLCPLATEQRPRTANEPGTNSMAWISDVDAQHQFAGSYTLNLALVADQPGPDTFKTIGSIAHATAVPLFVDGVWRETVPDNTCDPPPDFEHGGWSSPFLGVQRVCIDRHAAAVNVAFCDGHVERVRLPSLWKLQWGKHTQPRDVGNFFPSAYR